VARSNLFVRVRKIRKKKLTVGYGKNKNTVIDNWDLVGIEGLTSAGKQR